MRTTLTIKVEGSVLVHGVVEGGDEFQCGIRGDRDVFWHAEITCPKDARDEHGFLIDALEIHAIADKVLGEQTVMVSCENQALMLIDALREHCNRALKIDAQVGSHKTAYMMASWSAEADEETTRRQIEQVLMTDFGLEPRNRSWDDA